MTEIWRGRDEGRNKRKRRGGGGKTLMRKRGKGDKKKGMQRNGRMEGRGRKWKDQEKERMTEWSD